MKKMLIIGTISFIIVISILTILLMTVKTQNKQLQQINAQYEYYIGNEIYGTELGTLINKAIDNNKKYNVLKGEDGIYKSDNKYSIKISIQMLSNETVYDMEKIFEHKVEQFIKLFNTSKFKASEVQYHSSTGRISQIYFVQTQE